ncbi:unnamed protein product [Musa acuminata var. zebrina]
MQTCRSLRTIRPKERRSSTCQPHSPQSLSRRRKQSCSRRWVKRCSCSRIEGRGCQKRITPQQCRVCGVLAVQHKILRSRHGRQHRLRGRSQQSDRGSSVGGRSWCFPSLGRLGSRLTVQPVALEHLVGLLERLPSSLQFLVEKDGITLPLPREHVETRRHRLDLAETREERPQFIQGCVRGHVAHVNLPPGRVSGRGGADCSELAEHGSVPDPLLRLLEGLDGAGAGAEEDEAVALGAAGGSVDYDVAVFDGAVGAEGLEEGVAGGVPAEAVDEDLAVRDVAVGCGADAGGEVGVGGSGVKEEADQLLLGAELEEVLDHFGVGSGRGSVLVGGAAEEDGIVVLGGVRVLRPQRRGFLLTFLGLQGSPALLAVVIRHGGWMDGLEEAQNLGLGLGKERGRRGRTQVGARPRAPWCLRDDSAEF